MQHRRVEEPEARQPRWYAAWRDLTVRQKGELPQLDAKGRGIRGIVGRLRRLRQPGRLDEARAERAAQTRSRGSGVQYDPPIDLGRLRILADEAWLEQIRGDEACRERVRRIEKQREIGERVPPTRPTPQ